MALRHATTSGKPYRSTHLLRHAVKPKLLRPHQPSFRAARPWLADRSTVFAFGLLSQSSLIQALATTENSASFLGRFFFYQSDQTDVNFMMYTKFITHAERPNHHLTFQNQHAS